MHFLQKEIATETDPVKVKELKNLLKKCVENLVKENICDELDKLSFPVHAMLEESEQDQGKPDKDVFFRRQNRERKKKLVQNEVATLMLQYKQI